MARCKAEKMGALLSLANLDPNLLLLINVIGHKSFGTLVKTLGGLTVTIPTDTEIKEIVKQVKGYNKSFKKISRKNTALSNLAMLGMAIDNKDVRTAMKIVLTREVFEAYLRSVYESEDTLLGEEELENMAKDSSLDAYALSIKELEIRNNLLNNINLLSRKV